MRTGKIYQFTCTENGKRYVGSTVRSEKQRRSEHLHLLRNGKHHSRHFQRCFDKYGEESFVFGIIEIVDDLNFMLCREQFHIWRVGPGLLNAVDVSDSALAAAKANTGRVQGSEERLARSLSQREAIAKGTRKKNEWSKEQRLAHSERLTGRFMPPVSEKTRQNISKALCGRPVSINGVKASVAARTSFINEEVSLWLKMRESGMSYRQIEKETGRSRDVVSRECKRVCEHESRASCATER